MVESEFKDGAWKEIFYAENDYIAFNQANIAHKTLCTDLRYTLFNNFGV